MCQDLKGLTYGQGLHNAIIHEAANEVVSIDYVVSPVNMLLIDLACV